MLIGMFGTGSRDLDRVIRNAFAGGEDGIWVAPRLGGMYQDAALATPWSADGQAVGGYVDRSPNGYVLTQATAAARPLGYGDRLAGDGADDCLIGGDILDVRTRSFFIFVVVRFATGGAAQGVIGKSNTSSSDGRYMINRNDAGALQTFLDIGSPATASKGADTSTAKRVISMACDRAAGSIVLRENGVQVASGSFAPNSTDFDATMPFHLMTYDGTSRFLNGDMHECGVVMRAPVAGELDALDARMIVAHSIETGGG